jgi:hypothetical protein
VIGIVFDDFQTMRRRGAGSAQRPLGKGFVAGIGVGAVVIAILAIGLTSGLLSQHQAAATDSRSPILLVFAGHGEDGSRVSAFTVVVKTDGRAVLLDPNGSLSMPGVSATSVRDASAFTGASGIADVVGTEAIPLRFAEMDEATWTAALAKVGGVTVDIPKAIDTFDGARVRGYSPGIRTVEAADVMHLVNGAQYLHPLDRRALLGSLVKAVLVATGSDGGAAAKAAATEMAPTDLSKILATAAKVEAKPGIAEPAEATR